VYKRQLSGRHGYLRNGQSVRTPLHPHTPLGTHMSLHGYVHVIKKEKRRRKEREEKKETAHARGAGLLSDAGGRRIND
jgi:hypothetical protein